MARAVKQPSSKEVWQAAMALGYSPEIREKAALPMFSWDETGYVLLKRMGARPAMLRSIAGEVLKIRQRQADATAPKKR